jgi:hypothetical protein
MRSINASCDTFNHLFARSDRGNLMTLALDMCRDDGVFEEEYFAWLDTQIAKAPDLEAKYVPSSSSSLATCPLK